MVRAVFNSVGVETIPSIGTKFDPEMPEAIETAEVDAQDDGWVTVDYSRGDRFGDWLLRPARVLVGKPAMPSKFDR